MWKKETTNKLSFLITISYLDQWTKWEDESIHYCWVIKIGFAWWFDDSGGFNVIIAISDPLIWWLHDLIINKIHAPFWLSSEISNLSCCVVVVGVVAAAATTFMISQMAAIPYFFCGCQKLITNTSKYMYYSFFYDTHLINCLTRLPVCMLCVLGSVMINSLFIEGSSSWSSEISDYVKQLLALTHRKHI